MAAALSGFSDEFVDAADVRVHLRKGGGGEPLLILHGELGVPGWLGAYDLLARRHTVIVPCLPGYSQSSRPEWIMSVRDLAAWVTWFARDQGIRTPIDVAGFSLGGWIAAELATIAPQFFKKMVLVDAMGVKPREGEIWDYFLESGRRAFAQAISNPDQAPEFATYYGKEWTAEEAEEVELNREMTCRVAWKPYMHSLTLPNLLRGVCTPTLIVWGKEDKIVPLDSGRLYHEAINGSALRVLEQCGHMPEIERPVEFVSLVEDFLTA